MHGFFGPVNYYAKYNGDDFSVDFNYQLFHMMHNSIVTLIVHIRIQKR